MSVFDLILVALLILSAYQGFKAGFLMELFSLAASVLGILIGFKLMGAVMVILADKFNFNDKVLPYAAFGLVFVLVVVAISLVGKLLQVVIGRSVLGGLDGLAGGVLAVVRFGFMLSIVLWIVDSMGFKLIARMTEHSAIYPFLEDFAPAILRGIGKVLPMFDDVL